MERTQHTAIETMMEQLIANGSEDMASVFAGLFDLAMRIERNLTIHFASRIARFTLKYSALRDGYPISCSYMQGVLICPDK